MENNSDILKKINSGEPELIAEAVQEVKENGDLNIAEALLKNLEQIKEPHLVTIVVNLLADIKENSFRDILVQKIQTTTNTDVKKELLRIVWESALDYSAWIGVFLELLQQDDFEIAFEASTVIENTVHNLSEEQLRELYEIIHSFPEEKQYLVENIQDEMNCLEAE